MPRVDALLKLAVQQRANELRLASGKSPELLREGEPVKSFMPATSTDTLVELLGELLSDERWEQAGRSRITFPHEAGELGRFSVSLARRDDELEIVFVHGPAAPAAWDGRGDSEWRGGAGPYRTGAPAEGLEPAEAEPHGDGAPASPASVEPNAGPPVSSSAGAHATPDAPGGEEPSAAEPAPPGEIPPAAMEEPRVGAALLELLATAIEVGASDLHLAEGELPTLRIHGRLQPLEQRAPVRAEQLLAGLLTIPVRARLDAGLSADLGLDAGSTRCRVNLYRHEAGLAAALRLLPTVAPSLAELGLPVPLDDLVEQAHGLVVVCGPTGSGKSTTMAALAQAALRRRGGVLVSVEDPIEYRIDGGAAHALVRQRELGRHVRDFASGLRDALREDPDLLLVGEMRDPETMAMTLTAAETGHLILSSLHAASATSAVERIVDSFAADGQPQVRLQLADSLLAVVVQRLVPARRGRVVALEVLRVTHGVANLIREGQTAQLPTAIQSGGGDGMMALERCLADLVHARKLEVAAARAAANDRTCLDRYLRH